MVGIPGRKQTQEEAAEADPPAAPGLTVRTISGEQHLSFVRTLPSASFLQTPAWGLVKTEWRHESLGWFDADDKLVGAGLVLYRQLPKVPPLPRVPAGRPADRLDRRRHRRLADPDGRSPEVLGSVRHPDRLSGGGPTLARRHDQGRHRRRASRQAQPGPARRDQPRRHPAAEPAPRAGLAAAQRGRGFRRRATPVRVPAAAGRQDAGRAAGRDEPAVAAQHQEGGQGRRPGQPGRRRRPAGLPPDLRGDR